MFQEKVEILPDDNVEVLHDKLMEIGSTLVLKTVDALASGDVEMVPQQLLIEKGYLPSPAPKIFKEDCLIDWRKDALSLKNFVRGLSPYPTAWTNFINNDTGQEIAVKVFSSDAEVTAHDVEPGTIYSDGKTFLKIGCLKGWLSIRELQLAGKKRMCVEDFLRGFTSISQFRCSIG